MTIRRRLTLWYGAVLAGSLLLISAATYEEFAEQSEHGPEAEAPGHPLGEASEIIFHVGLPAIILGAAGGWWLTRRALKPLADLTRAAKGIDERTLDLRGDRGRVARAGGAVGLGLRVDALVGDREDVGDGVGGIGRGRVH